MKTLKTFSKLNPYLELDSIMKFIGLQEKRRNAVIASGFLIFRQIVIYISDALGCGDPHESHKCPIENL